MRAHRGGERGRTARWRSAGDYPLRLGISSCLLGNEVRYDGGHKHDPLLTRVLGPFVEWVPVCPEFEIGLGVPREAIRLVRDGSGIRLAGGRSGTDHTTAMHAWARKRVRGLVRLNLSGFVLKKDSPSCGMERVCVYGDSGVPRRDGRGLFAGELMRQFASLPVEEESCLKDLRRRENFIERVFAYQRLRSLFGSAWGRADIVAFHAAHRLQLLAHSPRDCKALSRLVGEARRMRPAELRLRYEAGLMRALAHLATPRRNVKVLHHILGHFRRDLNTADRAELLEAIAAYGKHLVPLIVPITLIRHHVRQLRIACLEGQVYLELHPKELMLRNHL